MTPGAVAVRGLLAHRGGTGHSWDVGMLPWGLAFGLCHREPGLSSFPAVQLCACAVTSPLHGANVRYHFILLCLVSL